MKAFLNTLSLILIIIAVVMQYLMFKDKLPTEFIEIKSLCLWLALLIEAVILKLIKS